MRIDTSHRTVGLVVAGCLGLLAVGFWWGQTRPAVHEATVECLSAPRTISCELPDDDWTIAIPLDVAWTDARGFHSDGRPACLPPTGIGLEGPVRIRWVPVEVDGTRWRQVVAVDCDT